MPYGDINAVKARLGINTTSFDQTKIAPLIQEADDFIDSQVGIFVSVPLNDAPPAIIRLSNRLASAWYIYWNAPEKERDMTPVNSIKKEIEQYVRAIYGKRTETMSENTWGKTASGMLGTEGS